jgi:hypothetical protein
MVDRPVLEANGSNLAAGGGDGEGSFRVGALTITLPASPRQTTAIEPPSLQMLSLDQVVGMFMPQLLLGLETFASPAPQDVVREEGPREGDGPLGQDDSGLGDLAVL